MNLASSVTAVLETATQKARQEHDQALLDAERMAEEFAYVRPSRFVFPHNAMLGFPVVNGCPEPEEPPPPSNSL